MPVLLVTEPHARWMPTARQIDEAARAARRLPGLVIASPANPTGTMLEPGRLAEIVAACRRNGLWFVSDEIYHGLTYGVPEADGARTQLDEAVVINSFSKYFSMTGWRVGWLVVPRGAGAARSSGWRRTSTSRRRRWRRWRRIGAFDGIEELEANKRVYAANRALLLDELPKAGLERIVPADGAFYLYVDVGDFTADSLAFTKEMLTTPASPPRRASTSTPSAAAATCASPTPARPPTWPRPRAGSQGWSRLERRSDRRSGEAPRPSYLQARAKAVHS